MSLNERKRQEFIERYSALKQTVLGGGVPEIEIRLRTFERNIGSRQAGTSVPGLDKGLWEKFQKLLVGSLGEPKEKELSLVEINPGFRKIITLSPGFKKKGKTIQRKKNIGKIDLENSSIRISLGVEYEITEKDFGSIDEISRSYLFRLRNRFSWVAKDGEWRYDLSEVKQRNLIDSGELVGWIDELKKGNGGDSLWEAEIEYIGKLPGTALEMLEKIQKQLVFAGQVLGDTSEIVDEESMTILRKVVVPLVGSGSSVSKLIEARGEDYLNFTTVSPKAVAFTVPIFEMIQSNPGRWAVTEKADGERFFLWVSSEGKCFLINSRNSVAEAPISVDKKWHNSLIDGELVEGDLYMIFDCIYVSGKDVSDAGLRERLSLLEGFGGKGKLKAEMKKFSFIGEDGFAESFRKLWKTKYRYEIDGVIYTPIDEGYRNKSYKWKSPETNSIDFLVMMIDAKRGELYSRISNADFRQYELTLPRDYYVKFPNVKRANNAFPVLFSPPGLPSDIEEIWIAESNDKVKLESGMVVEFIWDYSKKKFTPLRVRTDKTEEYKNGKLTPINYWTVALETLETMLEPITEEVMLGKAKLAVDYFKKDAEGAELIPLRKFHNFVKAQLYAKYAKGVGRLIEIAGGRGGDLNKWSNNKIKFVLLTDIDEEALKEANARYAQLKGKKETDLELQTLKVDWSEPLDKATQERIGKSQFDAISCQFAFHYFLDSETTLRNIYETISGLLKIGGYFFLTSLDGSRVLNYLNNERKVREGESANLFKNGKKIISIRRLYSGEILQDMGQEISVMMESIGTEHKEYLSNMTFLINYFVQEGKFKLVVKESFKDYYIAWTNKIRKEKNLSKESMMTDEEKEYSFMNSLIVLQRVDEAKN